MPGRHVTETVKEEYRRLRLGERGRTPHTQKAAAKKVGISRSTGARIDESFAPTLRLRKLPEAPHPLPFEKLGPDAKRAWGDFGFFRERYMGRRAVPWATAAAETLLELYHSPNDEYVVLNVAPGAGKSTMLTHDFVSWVILRERAIGEETTVLLGHRSEFMARRYVRRLRQTFEHRRDLIFDFGRIKPEFPNITWSQDELVVEPLEWDDLTEKDPTVTRASQEGGFVGSRASLAIWDDLVDKHNSLTAESREQVMTIWDTEAEDRINTGGLLVLSGARYGPEDLYTYCINKILEEDFDDEGMPKRRYRHIVFPAHFDDLCKGEHEEGVAKAWPEGCLLDPWPKKNEGGLPWQKIKGFKADNDRFRLHWQQEDVDPKGALADPAWFGGGTDIHGMRVPGCFDYDRAMGQLPRRDDAVTPLVSLVSVDPSKRNYWAVSHFLLYPGDLWVVLRGVRQPLRAPDLLERQLTGEFTGILEDWWKLSSTQGVPFRYLVWENKGAQEYPLQYEFFSTWLTGHGVVLVPHDTNKNKIDPDYSVEALTRAVYREGRIRLPYLGYEDRIYSDQFKREACAYPRGQTDDLPMHFWFAVHNAPALIAAAARENEPTNVVPLVPRWAQNPAVPTWAARSMGGTTEPEEPAWTKRVLVGAK
ncbi:MAG TPA: hypothetical protein VGR13_04180 [Actinomycetota bacterium]|jgi:hypothetical protein|nr:hypothetical protein [Actinomycetota bacterium]